MRGCEAGDERSLLGEGTSGTCWEARSSSVMSRESFCQRGTRLIADFMLCALMSISRNEFTNGSFNFETQERLGLPSLLA